MMLLYKTWLESRTRFLLSLFAMAGLSVVFVLFNHDVRTVVTFLKNAAVMRTESAEHESAILPHATMGN